MPLRLKSLELQGYKTFASKTTFEFASGITAIVGPNGSGKSNIADSLRWVLGEQSYTLLRGKKTEDMIFNGSEHRPRAGMASAHIVFDNTTGWLPVDYTEVGMTRRAFRDGHNEYLLNGQHVRLRDLNELLAASGLSERTYTILGQGLVDASLALKADERRRLFEEAAGVGLYRVRREDAFKRLENTSRNLERVLDIMSELEPRLRSLERQAKRAIEYSRAQANLKVILREWYGYHWHRAQQELTEAREHVKAQEARVAQAREIHQKAQEEYNKFRERFMGTRSQLNTWHHQSAQLHSQREEVSRELAVLEERRRSLLSTQSSLLADRDRASDEVRIARERLDEAEQEAARLQVEYEEAKKQYAEAQQALQSRQAERHLVEEKLQAARAEIEKRATQRAEFQARLDELEARLSNFQLRIESTSKAVEAAETSARDAGEKYTQARRVREDAEKELKKAEEKVESARREIERIENERRVKMDERANLLAEHTRRKVQLEVLEQAEHSLAGYAEGARFLLDAVRQSKLKGARGALSTSLDVPAELETAIAAALGDTLDAILLDASEVDEALQLLESDDSGRAALLPLGSNSRQPLVPPRDEGSLGVASELVYASDELRDAVHLILGQTVIVRDRRTARRLISDLPTHARIVTLSGEVFRGDGLIIAGKSPSAGGSTLSRPRQKREMTESLAVLSGQIESLNREVDSLSAQIINAQQKYAQAGSAMSDLRVSLEEAEANEQQARLESESMRRQWEWQKSQYEQLKSEVNEAVSNRQNLLQSQTELESQLEESLNQVRVLSEQLGGMDLMQAQEQTSYWGTRVAVVERAIEDALARKEERTKEALRFDTRNVELLTRLQEVETSLSNLEMEKASLRERELSLQTQMEELRVKIDPAEKDLESAEQEEARLQEAEANAQRALATAERLAGQQQLEQLRKQEALDNLRQRITDDFGLVMFEYAEDVSGPVPLPFEGMVEELPVVTEISPDLEAQLTHNRVQLRRMGPINPEAKQEFDAESERYSFMKTQVEDLRKAEEDIKQVITE
ncbi:MAG TPA: chromosome segregation protein SMC, partial [Anaerolineales bacterium]|nr:chromosome segregation protein SMC [Anaerolineales bacterium]